MGFQTNPGTLEPRPTDHLQYLRYPPGLEGSISILQVPGHYIRFILCTHLPRLLPALWRVELTGGGQTLVPL